MILYYSILVYSDLGYSTLIIIFYSLLFCSIISHHNDRTSVLLGLQKGQPTCATLYIVIEFRTTAPLTLLLLSASHSCLPSYFIVKSLCLCLFLSTTSSADDDVTSSTSSTSSYSSVLDDISLSLSTVTCALHRWQLAFASLVTPFRQDGWTRKTTGGLPCPSLLQEELSSSSCRRNRKRRKRRS